MKESRPEGVGLDGYEKAIRNSIEKFQKENIDPLEKEKIREELQRNLKHSENVIVVLTERPSSAERTRLLEQEYTIIQIIQDALWG